MGPLRRNMKTKIDQYLKDNAILKIGAGYADIIVIDPVDLINQAQEWNCYISEILWWERIEISNAEKSLGYGGPIDPRNNSYYFSETDYARKFERGTLIYVYIDYIRCMMKKYIKYDLYPSFTLSICE